MLVRENLMDSKSLFLQWHPHLRYALEHERRVWRRTSKCVYSTVDVEVVVQLLDRCGVLKTIETV